MIKARKYLSKMFLGNWYSHATGNAACNYKPDKK
jgi:hypothetical protein